MGAMVYYGSLKPRIPLGGVKLNSSWIKNIAYDASTGNLDVETKSGASYTYGAVPESVADEMLASDSKGTFHNENLRGIFDCVQTR
jgi:hypothetical protein